MHQRGWYFSLTTEGMRLAEREDRDPIDYNVDAVIEATRLTRKYDENRQKPKPQASNGRPSDSG